MSMSLVDLRLRMKLAGRNASSGYTNAIIDEAIDRLCARFLRKTRCVDLAFTVSFSATSNEADFSSLSGFLHDRIERMRIDTDTHYTKVEKDLNDSGIGTVLDKLACGGTSSTFSGTLCEVFIGFSDSTTAKLADEHGAAPAYDGTITGSYWPMQTPWTLGTMGDYSTSVAYVIGDVVASSGTLYRAIISSTNVAVATTTTWENLGTGTLIAPASIVSIIPDGLMSELIGTGGPPIMQAVDPSQVNFTGPQWQNYLAFEQSCMGIASISGKSTDRGSLRRGH